MLEHEFRASDLDSRPRETLLDFRTDIGGSAGSGTADFAFTGVGIHDALTGLIAAHTGFDFVWVSSFGVSAASGHGDVGILRPERLIAIVKSVRAESAVPIVIDMDSGYGGLEEARDAAAAFAAAGANAICIEDNPTVKRSSLYGGLREALVSAKEHARRVEAVRSAVDDVGTCAVVARTEALVAGGSRDEALERLRAYRDAGADGVFVQCVAPDGGSQLLETCLEWARTLPLFVAPSCYPRVERSAFFEAGATHFVYANHGVRAAFAAIRRTFAALAMARGGWEVEETLASVGEVSDMVGHAALQSLA